MGLKVRLHKVHKKLLPPIQQKQLTKSSLLNLKSIKKKKKKIDKSDKLKEKRITWMYSSGGIYRLRDNEQIFCANNNIIIVILVDKLVYTCSAACIGRNVIIIFVHSILKAVNSCLLCIYLIDYCL